MQIAENYHELPLTLVVVVGVAHLKVLDAMSALQEGATIVLARAVGEPLDIALNGTIVARGDCELSGERVTLRVTSTAPVRR